MTHPRVTLAIAVAVATLGAGWVPLPAVGAPVVGSAPAVGSGAMTGSAPAVGSGAVTGSAPVVGSGAAAGAATPLAPGGVSGFAVRAQVIAADPTTIVYASVGSQSADVGHALEYFAAGTDGSPSAPFPADGGLGGDQVPLGGTSAGTTYLTPVGDGQGDPGVASWADLASGASGQAGQFWQAAIPGGGAWVTSVAGVTTLESSTTADPGGPVTVRGALPGITGPAGTGMVADTAGVAVWLGTVLDYYSFTTHAAVTLDTAGLTAGLTCFSVGGGAVGCAGATQVVRVPVDGGAPVVVATTTPADPAASVAVIGASTAWLDRAGALRVRPATGSAAASTLAAGGVSALVSDGTAFVWSRGTGVWTGTEPADTRGRAVVAPLPLQASRIAVTAGRVAWIDDSATTLPVRSRIVDPTPGARLRLGATRTVISSSLAEPVTDSELIDFQAALDVSGRRTVTVGRPVDRPGAAVGDVILNDGTTSRVIATGGDGDVAISGTRVLYGRKQSAGVAPEDVYLYDLRTRRTTDLTARYGIHGQAFEARDGAATLAGRLFGRYLGYADQGDVRRLDLVTGLSETVARGRAGSGGGVTGGTVGAVLTAGDWVAWSTAGGQAVHYRNARTLGPVRTLSGYRLRSVSQAGLVASAPHRGVVFRRWGTTVDHPLPNAPTDVVAGAVVAWLGPTAMPTAEALPAGAAAPEALGAALAPSRVQSGGHWSIDQPLSQGLRSCRVVLRRLRPDGTPGPVVARLGCAASSMAQGDAIATWTVRVGGRPAPVGAYRWQVVAANAAGAALASTGAPGPAVVGTLTVVR